MPSGFIDGEDFEEVFETEQGPLSLFASTHIFNEHLVLEELLVYPEDQERLVLGPALMFLAFRLLEKEPPGKASNCSPSLTIALESGPEDAPENARGL